jgi:hypothetical protein
LDTLTVAAPPIRVAVPTVVAPSKIEIVPLGAGISGLETSNEIVAFSQTGLDCFSVIVKFGSTGWAKAGVEIERILSISTNV